MTAPCNKTTPDWETQPCPECGQPRNSATTAPCAVRHQPRTTETKHYTDGSSATGPGPLSDHSPEQQARAKVVAGILTENGMPVSSPDEGDLDDVERERWNACVEIVRKLDAWTPPPGPRYSPTDPVPKDFMEVEHEQYPLCPECGGDTGLIAYPYEEGRAWRCVCGWEGERHV